MSRVSRLEKLIVRCENQLLSFKSKRLKLPNEKMALVDIIRFLFKFYQTGFLHFLLFFLSRAYSPLQSHLTGVHFHDGKKADYLEKKTPRTNLMDIEPTTRDIARYSLMSVSSRTSAAKKIRKPETGNRKRETGN